MAWKSSSERVRVQPGDSPFGGPWYTAPGAFFRSVAVCVCVCEGGRRKR